MVSIPLRQQYGFNTDLTGYTSWTPVPDASVEGGNFDENFYIVTAGVVTLDMCCTLVMAASTSTVDMTTLPVAPETSTIVSNAVTLINIEDGSTLPATLDIDEASDSTKVTLTVTGTLVISGFYVFGGTLNYPEA